MAKTSLQRSAALAAAFGLAGALAPAARALELTVELSGARSRDGTVSVALYGSAEGWMKQALAAQRVEAGERVTVVFRGLAPGAYAVAAFHDANGNGKLDTNVVGIPTEAFGFSRDARGSFGPPKFDAAAFELASDLTVKVGLR
jgi:uncharacterized protein (DUF2141 family)